MDEKMIEISNRLQELDIFRERAFVICDEINQDYFDLDRDADKLLYFERYRIMNDILFDYLVRMDEEIGNLQRFVEK